MSLLLAKVEKLTSMERYFLAPVILLSCLAIIAGGIQCIRTKRFTLKKRHQWMYGKTEMTGKIAIVRGVVFCLIGVVGVVMATIAIVTGEK